MLLCFRALQEDLSYFIRSHGSEVLREVQEAYSQMPSRQMDDVTYFDYNEALDILLARRGKVRDFNTWGNCDIVCLSPGEGQHTRNAWDRTFDFWIYIRDELRRHGVDARLIFTIGMEPNRIAYDADDIEQFHYKHGCLTWLPLTYFDENLKRV